MKSKLPRGVFFRDGLHWSQPSESLRLQKTDEDFMQVHPLTLGDFTHPPEFVVLGISTFKGPEIHNPQYDYDHVIICHHFQ